jgi:hypothetical protein
MPNRKSRSQNRRQRSIIAFEIIRLDRTATTNSFTAKF